MRELRHVVTIVDYKILGVMDDVRWNESHKCLHMGFEASVRATSPTVLLQVIIVSLFVLLVSLYAIAPINP